LTFTSARQKTIFLLFSLIIATSIILVLVYTFYPIFSVRASAPVENNNSIPSGQELIRFDQYRNLTDNDQDSVYGQVATSGNNVYVVWQESIAGETVKNNDVLLKRSNNSGESFGENFNLSNNQGFSEHPQISSTGNSVYVVWADDSNGNRQIIFRKSIDNGDSFSKGIELSDLESQVSESAEVSSFGDSVYVVWLEKVANETHRVMLRSSNDRGTTFGEPQILSENAMDYTHPKVSSFGENVYVSWNVDEAPAVDSGVYFVSSSDNAGTFGNVTKLNRDKTDFGEPQIASYGNSVYVIWGGSLNNNVNSLFVTASEDYGKTFAEPKSMGETDLGKLVSPRNVEITADGMGRLFILWQDRVQTPDKQEVLFASSKNGGQSFDYVTNLSKNIDFSECPSIAAYGNMLFSTWEGQTAGNKEIFFMTISV
jgi:hypothetical protein